MLSAPPPGVVKKPGDAAPGEAFYQKNARNRENAMPNANFAVRLGWSAVALALLGGPLPGQPPREPLEQVLFASGQGGYHTYRIPALAATPKGTLLAFCEGRKTSRSDAGDIDLLVRRSEDGGATWSKQQIVHEEGGEKKITIGNPCPVVDRRSGAVILAFTRNNDRVFVTRSDDDGRTWAAPTEITAQVKKSDWAWYATGPGHGIQLARGPHKGRLVFPCDHRVKDQPEGRRVSRSHAFYSDDGGKTFQLGRDVEGNVNECEAVELSDGALLLSMRNRDAPDLRAFAVSKDGGRSWSPPKHHEQVYCPVCQAAIHRHSWQPSVILYSGPGGKGRNNLTIRASYDEGQTWPIARRLHDGGSAYSDLAVLDDGTICCLYEADGYKTLTFARLSLNWLKAGKP